MPITNFTGVTFVAFIDISGFKVMMNDKDKAWKALDHLYKKGFNILNQYRGKVEGLFISDCGILFARENIDHKSDLINILKVIKKINNEMIAEDFMLTTTIAFGEFKYEERIEFPGIGKHPIYGDAYVSAFLDNENGKPKIQPGLCRIVKKNLPSDILEILDRQGLTDITLNMISAKTGDKEHYYYYWMREHSNEIDEFEKQYNHSYNLKFAGMIKALKKRQNII